MSVTLEPGKTSRLSPLVRRIVAPNPSVMTGAGTNTYLVGNDEIAVIDPGPDIPEHVDAIAREGDGRIRWIVVTHTHTDHSPAALPLARATGAELRGASPPLGDPYQDESFAPAHELIDGDTLRTTEFALRAVHTPGHVGNHYCLLVEAEGMLMTGDHIMNGSTVVIVPPSGDMKDYIDSLRILKKLPLRHLAPGHGELMSEPMAAIDALIAHRLGREKKVMDALLNTGGGTLEELLPHAYDDVPVALHRMARYSLLAHLLKLERESAAQCRAEHWSAS